MGSTHRGHRLAARFAILWALQPTPYARAVSTVDITELAFEIGFLAATRRA
jgi:hypothetical protein